ncbi:hypothetical protein BUALT_Bualt01G0134300 [Buddleja alternifolia]|uniref:RING-type E3 ubiquitin transferase n=1 Tax=Buddleja alternifolia TaxID=168488 RepID=A0AAV6YHA7_9LAMI|nr:hypothetical protein BUALT_Bualt01G0134300 [Buddleja alternifolia]
MFADLQKNKTTAYSLSHISEFFARVWTNSKLAPMQGHRSSLSTLPENISFDHGSSSSDAGIDSQMPWNNMQSETNIPYLHHVRHEAHNGEWSLGETSSGSSQTQREQNERKREHTWPIHSRASLNLEEPSNILSLDNVDVNANSNQISNGLQVSGSNAIPQDLNMLSGFGHYVDDDCQVVERSNTCISVGAPNEHMTSNGSSSGSYAMGESEDTPMGSSMEGRRMPCKRKAIEVNVGQSSEAGSSNFFNHAERSQWHSVPPAQIAPSSIMQTENGLVVSNGPDPENPRLRLGVIGAVSASPFSLTGRGPSESARRNFRLRINGGLQQDHIPNPDPFLMEADIGNPDVSPSRHSSSLLLRNRLFDLNPASSVEKGISPHRQPVPLNVPSVRRNHQSRWNGASSSRTSSSSIGRDATLYEEPLTRNIPRSLSEHPMFVPASDIGSSSQQNYNLVGETNNIAENIASSSRAGSNPGQNSSSPTWANRGCPQYPRRLSEIVRRSLLSSGGIDSVGQSRNHGVRSATPQETAPSSGSGVHGHARSNSRAALLERHLDGAIPIPYSLRTLAAAGEGRSSIMSEIRHVLDLMRRGEGLRFEDVMMLDHSVLFGMADIHDRHRDMRLDVDNMSYEELLALGERIGNVCTGLTEETIMSRLKLQKYVGSKTKVQVETEPCSICREEYNDGEDVGTLECGHDFHKECIKQWLLQKNLCPICKTTGLTT